MNNFDFLNANPQYRSFSKDCIDAERAFQNSYDSCVKLVRSALDAAIKFFYAKNNKVAPDNLFDMIENANLDKLRKKPSNV